jgi:hypothetical protein
MRGTERTQESRRRASIGECFHTLARFARGLQEEAESPASSVAAVLAAPGLTSFVTAITKDRDVVTLADLWLRTA